MQKNAQIQEQDEPRVTRHIFVAMFIGFLGSSTGNLVILATTRDLLEIDLLVPTSFFMDTGLTLLTYKHILLSSGLCAFGAALLMCFLTSKTKVPDKFLFGIMCLCFMASCRWPFSLPITLTFTAKLTLFCMHGLGTIAITAPMLRARDCALRDFVIEQITKPRKASSSL